MRRATLTDNSGDSDAARLAAARILCGTTARWPGWWPGAAGGSTVTSRRGWRAGGDRLPGPQPGQAVRPCPARALPV